MSELNQTWSAVVDALFKGKDPDRVRKVLEIPKGPGVPRFVEEVLAEDVLKKRPVAEDAAAMFGRDGFAIALERELGIRLTPEEQLLLLELVAHSLVASRRVLTWEELTEDERRIIEPPALQFLPAGVPVDPTNRWVPIPGNKLPPIVNVLVSWSRTT